MRKSSLGRRSSTHIPVRVPSLGGSSGQRTCSGKKQPTSYLKPPGFTQAKYRRSQSEERESYGGRPSTLVRSNTAGMLPGRGVSMTPKTPRQSLHSNLPTGSARAPRSQQMSIETTGRKSSFGGKSTRKDTRPIGEKAFQQSAQQKVQEYFDNYGSDVIGPGTSIRPMNTKLFVDMIDHLLKNFDSRIVLTKNNYLEELPVLLRKLGYRSKIERSWLMTVNTPHSWQHVIAVLSWLVEAIECMNAVEPYDMMHNNDLSMAEEDDPPAIPITKELIHYLKKTYSHKDDLSMDDEKLKQMDREYIFSQMIKEKKCTDEDFEILQREVDLAIEEYDSEAQKRDLLLSTAEKLQQKHNAVLKDHQTIESYIEDSKKYINTTENKIKTMEEEINFKKSKLEKKHEQLKCLQEKISSQHISLDEKDKLVKEKHDLHREILFHENAIREYEKSAYGIDLKYHENIRKLEKLILDYNKLVAEKTAMEPRLKDVEVKFHTMSKSEGESYHAIDDQLKLLKEEYKNSLHELEAKREESEKILWSVTQDKKETEEEIAKETNLLEGVECDLEKKEELINKETQKLKDEIARYQKWSKEIIEEMAQFNQDKYDEKKKELKKIEHDWELVQKRTKQLLDAEVALTKEKYKKLKAKLDVLNKHAAEFEKNFT